MLPHLGQGANQSIEDGIALATILARADRATAPSALLAYEQLRRERVAQVQRGARENGLRYDSAYSDLGVRDAEITAHAAFRKRLYDHDVVPDAQAAAAALASRLIARGVGLCAGRGQTGCGNRDDLPRYRRPIRDGVSRSNERNFRISPFPLPRRPQHRSARSAVCEGWACPT